MTDLIQGSQEWHQVRCGRVTASRVADVIAQNRSRNGWGASRATYMGELIAERLSGNPTESFSNAVMDRGNEVEPEARNAYAFFREVTVTEVGFVIHPTIEQSGASPDGLVGDDGLIQIKCPNTSTHIDTVLKKKVSGRYETQMMWEMACTGRKWCDFASYDPRLPSDLCLEVIRIERDEERIRELEGMVREFLTELDDTILKLRAAA